MASIICCEILSSGYICCFLSSYDLISTKTSRTRFLSIWKLICFCFKLKAYNLFEFMKIFLLNQRIFAFATFILFQFCSLAAVTTGCIFFPVKQDPIFMMVFLTNGFLAFTRNVWFWIFAHSVFNFLLEQSVFSTVAAPRSC